MPHNPPAPPRPGVVWSKEGHIVTNYHGACRCAMRSCVDVRMLEYASAAHVSTVHNPKIECSMYTVMHTLRFSHVGMFACVQTCNAICTMLANAYLVPAYTCMLLRQHTHMSCARCTHSVGRLILLPYIIGTHSAGQRAQGCHPRCPCKTSQGGARDFTGPERTVPGI